MQDDEGYYTTLTRDQQKYTTTYLYPVDGGGASLDESINHDSQAQK